VKPLVTGGTGFIGTALVERLARSGATGVVLDLWAPETLPEGWRYVCADVRDGAAVAEAAQGCDGIFHLAAAHHDRGISSETYFGVNRDGTLAVVAAAESHGIQQICFLSSVAVYGDGSHAKHEQTPPAPSNPYGASKLAAEAVLGAWCSADRRRRALIIRPTAVIGPNNFANLFALCVYLDRPLFVSVGMGRNHKSLAYLENLVEAILVLWGREGGSGVEVYNYADKPDLTSSEIIARIREGLGRQGPGIRLPLGLALLGALPFEVLGNVLGKDLGISRNRIQKLAEVNSVVDTAQIQAVCSFPRIPLTEGLRRTLAWYVAEGRGRSPVKRIPPEQPLQLSR